RRSRPTSYIAPTARAPSSSPKAAPSSPPTTSGPLRKFMWRLAGQRRLSRRCSSSKADTRIPSSSRLASDAADSAIHPHDLRNGPLGRGEGGQGLGQVGGGGDADMPAGLVGELAIGDEEETRAAGARA